MTGINIHHHPEVKLIDFMGGDISVVRAARVSVVGENGEEVIIPEQILNGKDAGLINYLSRNKHGSPFEHTAMTFFVRAPIFVFREFMRHRIGFSYNEMSGRYTKLEPDFYIPTKDRPLVNVGTSAKPEFAPGTPEQYQIMFESHMRAYEAAWREYEIQLEAGIANEVARDVLNVGIESQMYVTLNARSMMSFLTLRTRDERATFVSRPQEEIQMVARDMEEIFAELFPVTYEAFNKNGRVAP